MSDIGSISFGQMFPGAGVPGNMSAAQASAGYAGPAAQSQNVFNNTIRNLEYDQRLFQHYYEQSLRGVANIGAPAPPGKYGYGPGQLDPGGSQGLGYSGYRAPWDMPSGRGGGGGAPLASPYQTTPDVWTRGASPFFGSGGSSGMGGSLYGTPQYGGPGIDWGGVGRAAADFGGSGGGGGYSPGGLSSLGGLGGAPYTPLSGGPSLDWTQLFRGGPQQPPSDFGSLFGRSAGGMGGAPVTSQPAAPSFDTSRSTAQPSLTDLGAEPKLPSIDWTKLFTGGSTADAAPRSVFDTGTSPIAGAEFAGPRGGGIGAGGLDWGKMMGAPYTRAAEPQRGMLQEPVTKPYERYFDVTSPYGNRSGGEVVGSEAQARPEDTSTGGALTPGGGLPAADLMQQARERLAKLMAGPETPAKIPVPPGTETEFPGEAGRGGMVGRPAAEDAGLKAGERVPLPRERPAAAETTDYGMRGRQDALETLRKELQASNLIMTSGYRDPGHKLSEAYPGSAHAQGRAFDVRARTPEQADAAMSQIRELLAPRGLVEGKDYRIIDEVRHPSPHATGPHVHTQFTEQGMQKYQNNVYQDPNPPRPPAGIPVPIPSAGPAAPADERQTVQELNPSRPPADIPFPDGVPLPASRPAAANIAQAHTLLDTTVGDLVRKNSPSDVGRVPSSIADQPLREALGNAMTGGLIRSGITPYLPKLGVTPAEFDKAYTQGRLVQPPRFGGAEPGAPAQGAEPLWAQEGTPRWNNEIYEAFTGGVMRRPEQQTVGGASQYEAFPRSENVEDRRTEQLSRDQLAALKARGKGYVPEPEPAGVSSNPMSIGLGINDIERSAGTRVGLPRTGAPVFQDTEDRIRNMFPGNRLVTPTGIAGDDALEFGSSRGAGTRAMQEAYPDVPSGIFTGNFARPESNDLFGQPYPSGLVQRFEDLPDLTPPAPGWGDWLGNIGKQMGNPFVSPAEGAGLPGSALNTLPVPTPAAPAAGPDMSNFQSPANDYSTFQRQPFIPPWQASIPSDVNSPEMRDAIVQAAQQQGVRPPAIAGVVNTEDPKWNPRLRDPDSSYVGLTQMGPDTWKSPGMPGTTWEDYSQRMTGPEQIQAYSQWLDSYGALDRARAYGIDVNALSDPQQAALLQGLQFAPNTGLREPGVRDWLTPYAQGNANMATTTQDQAEFLSPPGSLRPTMGSMTDYYRRLMADQVAGADRRWPQQQLFNTYYPTQMPRY